jgi:histidinol phosphatase-like PHP family hydrolase
VALQENDIDKEFEMTPPADVLDQRTAATEFDFPLVDLHAHLEGELSLERALEIAQARGVTLGVVEHGGRGQALHDTASLQSYIESLEGSPVYTGMQAEGLDWTSCFTVEAVARLDFVLSDALTFPERDGTRVRLWEPHVRIDDAQDFMERYVDFYVEVMAREPIDILANPTFLPACIEDRYDALWTPTRMGRVIEAAVRYGVAIEINARYRIPSPAFLRLAREAGVRFSFGSNHHGEAIGRLEYCLEMADELGLTTQDVFTPQPPGLKPIQTRSLA